MLVVRVEAFAGNNTQAGLADGRRLADEHAEPFQSLLDKKAVKVDLVGCAPLVLL